MIYELHVMCSLVDLNLLRVLDPNLLDPARLDNFWFKRSFSLSKMYLQNHTDMLLFVSCLAKRVPVVVWAIYGPWISAWASSSCSGQSSWLELQGYRVYDSRSSYIFSMHVYILIPFSFYKWPGSPNHPLAKFKFLPAKLNFEMTNISLAPR